ncbi:MAG: hypothetical protein ACK4GO_17775 [Gemmobacter sp.]
MTRNTKLGSAFGTSLLVLAACGGGGGVVDAVSQFGPNFAAAFRADPHSEPADDPNLVITFMGVTGPNLTADPIDI